MKRIKPKWLLGAMMMTLAVAMFAVSVLAATPEYLNITSPTAINWLARKSGAAVTLTFDYTSNPSVPPVTTRALGRMCLVGADPTNPDLDTVIVEAWQDIANGTGLSASINLTIPASQAEGSYDARVVLTNSDGGPITDWEVGAIIVDNTAPNAPTNLAIADDVNPGPDGYINDTTPTFNWTAATDNGNPASGIAKHWVQIDAGAWVEVAAPTTTYTVGVALADGAHIARVKAEDKAGNVGPEATINFTVDTAAPAVPTLNAEPTYTKGTTNTITWSAVVDPVTNTCQYYAEYTTDSLWGTVSGNSGWMADTSWTVTGLTSGTKYYYRVKARDLAGNVTATSVVEASTQDDVAPSFGSPSPADGAWVNTATPTISIPVSDTGAGIDGSSATISIDGGAPVAATYDSLTGTISYTPAALAEGTHTVTISVKDAAYPPAGPGPDGNLATVTWSFGVDVTAPALSGTPTGYITINNPTLSVNFDDTVAGVTVSGYGSTTALTLDAVSVLPVSTEPASGAATGTITKTTSALAQGSHTVSITVRDRATNSTTLGWTFFVDTVAPTPPTVTVTSPTNDTTPTFTWSGAADAAPSSGLASYTIEIWSGAAMVRGPYSATYAADPFSWTVPDADALTPDGSYEIRVWAVDAAGNVSATYGSATVVVDTVAPTLSGNTPTGYINTASPTLTVTFDDTVGATTVSGYGSTTALTLDGVSQLPFVIPPDSQPASGAATGTITKATSGLAEGSHTVSITVADKAGNSTTLGTVASPWTFFVDTQPPTPPAVTVTSPTNDTTPTFTFNGASDPAPSSGLASYTIEIWSGGVKVRGPYTAAYAADPFNWTVPDVDALTPDGSYEIRVWSVDAASNVSTTYGSATVVIDTARPVLSNGSPTGYVATTTNTISADFTDVGVGLDTSGTSLTVTNAGTPYGPWTSGFTGTNYVNGSLSTTIELTLTGFWDGQWTVDMVAHDLAGNKSTPDATLQWTFNVDTTPPTDPGSPVAGNMRDDGNWYINTLRPTFSWAASVDPDAPDGTPGSGLRDYSFQFGTSATKPASGVDAWPSALVNETGIAPTPGAAVQQWTPSSDLPLAVGEEYSARVKAFDNLNNATLWIDPPIIYDPDPPTAPGTPSTTTPTNDPTPEWTWAGSTDAISGVDLYHIQIRRQGSADWDVLDTLLDIPDSTAPADPQIWEQGLQLQDGTYEIRVRGMDVAGNYSEWSGTGTVTVDTTPPAVPGMPQTTSPTNDTTPTWTWGAVSGAASYNVYLDDAFVGNQAGTSYTPGSALSEGQHYLQVSSLDALGNESALSEAGYVVIDTTDPAAPEMMALPEYTNEDSVTFIWSAVTDAVKYDFSYSLDGGATWSTVTDLTVQTYTVDISGASDGDVIQGKAIAYDAAGNDSVESNVVSTTVDRTGPVVSVVTTPSSPTTDATPTWEWSGDDGSGCGVAGYWVTLDSEAPIWTTATSFTPSAALVDGDHVLVVVGVDNLGNEGAALTFATVTIDTTPPAVPGMPQTTSPTNDATPTWTWGAVSGAASYNVYLDEAFMGNQVGTSYTPSAALPEGQHYLQVSSLDDLGNESAKSEAGYVVIDTVDPAAPEMLPLAEYTNADDLIFVWSAVTDAVKYDFSYSLDGGATWTTVTDLTVQTYTVDISGASDGDVIQGKAIAYDAAGNDSAESNAVSTTVDRTGPVVSVVTTPSSPTTDATPTWEWSGTDAGCGVAGYWVTLDSEAPIWTTATSFTPSADLVDGGHILKVKGVDNLGNEGTEIAFATVVIDTTPPAVPGMPQTTSPTNDTTPTWTWGAVSGAASYNVYLDEAFMGNQVGTSYTPSAALPEGQHYLQVSSLDDLGNESAKSEAGYVVIDTTPPAAPAMLPLPAYTNADNVIFIWSQVTDAVKYDFSYSLDGGATWTTVTDLTVQTYTVDISGVADGAVILGKAIAYDAAGNDSAESNVVVTIVDRTGPVVTPVSPVAPVTTADATPTWTWSGTDAGCGVMGYVVSLDAEAPIWTTATSFTPSSDLVDGAHVLKVKGVDYLGNEGAEFTFATITVDATPPAVPVMAAEPEFTAGTENTVSWSASSDSGSGLARYEVRTATTQEGLSTATPVDNGLNTQRTFTGLADGVTHYYQVRAVDNVGNASAWSNIVSSTQDATAPNAPAGLTCNTPATDNTPTFNWNSGVDPVPAGGVKASGVARYDLQWRPSGGSWTVVDVGEHTTWTVTSAWADGTYQIQVRAIDKVGNVGAWSAALQITIDTTPPSVEFINPTHGGTFNVTTASTIIAEIVGEFNAAEAWLYIDGGKVAPTAIVGNILYYVVGVPFRAGEHTVAVTVKDAAGNQSAPASITFTVQNYREGFGFGRLRFPEPPE